MRFIFASSLFAVALLASNAAMALTFEEIDTDADGLVSSSEFSAAYPDIAEDVWAIVDADADGMIAPDEHQAAADSGLLPPA